MKTYLPQEVFESIGKKELKKLLVSIINEDYYLKDFKIDPVAMAILDTLNFYNIVFISNKEKRVLLTQQGEIFLCKLIF